MQLLPDAPDRRQRGQPLEQGAGVGVGKVGMGDIGVLPAGGVSDRLNPSRLVVTLSRRPVSLDVD